MTIKAKLFTAAALAGLMVTPAAALADTADTVEAASPKGEAADGAATHDDGKIVVNVDAWKSMQCAALLYVALQEPQSEDGEAMSQEGLYLNLGYHLGRVNSLSSNIRPADLILPAINAAFAKDESNAEATPDIGAYCQATAASIAGQTAEIDAVVNAAQAGSGDEAESAAEAR